jgi:hypothetical protein
MHHTSPMAGAAYSRPLRVAAPEVRNIDFMAYGYGLIQEPLNLTQGGRQWFARVREVAGTSGDSHGIVLGATAWMAALLRQTHRRITCVDMSATMLAMAQSELQSVDGVHFVQADWLEMPRWREPADAVIGDNAFSFLPFPLGWVRLCDELADRMSPDATLTTRALCVPCGYRTVTPDEIVERFRAREVVNYTEVRAMLLFSHWHPRTYGIDTESVLQTFEAHAHVFEPLLAQCPPGKPNDLTTLVKYRNSGAIYYAPPLDEWLRVLRQRFRVIRVHFGPYAMSEYFPLVVASRI